MPTPAKIRGLDDVKATSDRRERLQESGKIIADQADAALIEFDIWNIFYSQGQGMDDLPGRDHDQQGFEMIAEPLPPARWTRPVPAAEFDLERSPTMAAVERYISVLIVDHLLFFLALLDSKKAFIMRS